MKYRDLEIQTQREAPNNARTRGFAFLVRAGYLTRENTLTKLGEHTVDHLRKLGDEALSTVAVMMNKNETFFAIDSGNIDLVHCPSCKYTERLELARFKKSVWADRDAEPPIRLEKIATPNCNTIESLTSFLNIQKEKTAKAVMYTRVSDRGFVFAVLRGDMQLSEAKLKAQVGDVRPATADEIVSVGAVPGYASAIGLKEALIVVDDLIPEEVNLVAGANEAGYHLLNTNYGRDYSAEIVTDLIRVQESDACVECGNRLSILSAIDLTNDFKNILLALAETHHDDKGLTLPHPVVPFDVYLLHVSSKELDTRAKAEEIYATLRDAGIPVLFDDRDERAGVKFNDADLIGLPIRITTGERGLKTKTVEVKKRDSSEITAVHLENIAATVKSIA